MRERYVVINGSINGKELSVSTKKNPERKFQTETHTVIGKAAGDFQNQQKIQKNDREQRLARNLLQPRKKCRRRLNGCRLQKQAEWQCTKIWWM
ncbi:MAG: hypothetical protein ACLR8P_09160 [Clostridium fessum]